jgi:hypothetical protein
MVFGPNINNPLLFGQKYYMAWLAAVNGATPLSFGTTEGPFQYPVTAAVLQDLIVAAISGNTLNGNTKVTIRIKHSGTTTATAITVTIPGGSTSAVSDLVHQATYANGDFVSLEVDTTASTSGSLNGFKACVLIVPSGGVAPGGGYPKVVGTPDSRQVHTTDGSPITIYAQPGTGDVDVRISGSARFIADVDVATYELAWTEGGLNFVVDISPGSDPLETGVPADSDEIICHPDAGTNVTAQVTPPRHRGPFGSPTLNVSSYVEAMEAPS